MLISLIEQPMCLDNDISPCNTHIEVKLADCRNSGMHHVVQRIKRITEQKLSTGQLIWLNIC